MVPLSVVVAVLEGEGFLFILAALLLAEHAAGLHVYSRIMLPRLARARQVLIEVTSTRPLCPEIELQTDAFPRSVRFLHALIRGRSLPPGRPPRAALTPLVRVLASQRAVRDTGSPLLSVSQLDTILSLPGSMQIQVFVEVTRSLSGANRDDLRRLAAQVGLLEWAARLTRHRRWTRRLEGARVFTLFGTGIESMLPLFNDPNPFVRSQAAEWAADVPSPEIIATMLNLLGTGARFSRFTVQDTLLRMGSAVVEPLAAFLAQETGQRAEEGLRVAIGIPDSRMRPAALALCHDLSPRVRSLAASLLGAVGGQEGVERLVTLLDDEHAAVRAAACDALGTLGHWPAAVSVARLLRDDAWPVRRSAGNALRAFGAPGLLLLRRYARDGDTFAADMARQILDLIALERGNRAS